MSLRTYIIQKVVNVNEQLIFYPKLKRFYTSVLGKKTLTVLDVGSNKGQSIDFFLNINPHSTIFGFEPNHKLYHRLVKKYQDNSNIELHHVGLSSKEGTLVFHENIMDETSTFEQLNKDSEYLKRKAQILGVSTDTIIVDSYEVEVTTLSTFLRKHPDIFVDVLKIDVEGHEFDCLLGLFKVASGKGYPIRYIQLESHHDDMYLNDNNEKIEALLKQSGFAEVARIKHGFGDFYEIIFENTFLK